MAPSATFFTSSLIVRHNAFKNIIFRLATLTLDFLILRLFGLLAFRQEDYTSFLMFAEDIIQKAFFISARGTRVRQSLLVATFALVAGVGEFYDTMLWALDNPGTVMEYRGVEGAALANSLLPTPSYVVLMKGNFTAPDAINTLDTSFRMDLYSPGLNFTLPGVVQKGTVEVFPPLYPLNPVNATARIWLDDEGFAVGLDPTMMTTPNMTRSLDTMCAAQNDLGNATAQVWNCNIPQSESLAFLQLKQGLIPIWWDEYHPDWLLPYDDNPWSSLGSGTGTMMMKQVFTVTKGRRRHTFLSTFTKASMTTPAPNTLDNGEISDFMRRTWSADGSIREGIQDLIDVVLYAKGNNTGRTFGDFVQTNISVVAMSTDYLSGVDSGGASDYSVLRFTLTNTTLIRSETLAADPLPFEPCPGVVYRNIATGGKAISTNCNVPEIINQTWPSGGGHFLGQLDTSAVGIFAAFLGDGTSNLSSVALSQASADWVREHESHMDNLLISRALLLGGDKSAVTVDVGHSVAAISGLQLLLCILPVVLAAVTWWLTRKVAMSYYQSSFLSAVLATTHISSSSCERLGYIRSMPDIGLRRRGGHVRLATPNGGEITNTVSAPTDEHELIYEPLMFLKDSPK